VRPKRMVKRMAAGHDGQYFQWLRGSFRAGRLILAEPGRTGSLEGYARRHTGAILIVVPRSQGLLVDGFR
jgi:hypothetical protein